MNGFAATRFITTLAIGCIVVIIAASLSDLVERSGLPQVAVFLTLGVASGLAGLGVSDVPLDAPALRIIATLTPCLRALH